MYSNGGNSYGGNSYGYIAENKVQKLLEQTRLCVLQKNAIIAKYVNNSYNIDYCDYIDHMIDGLNNGGGGGGGDGVGVGCGGGDDIAICFQDKFMNSNITYDKFVKFATYCNYIALQTQSVVIAVCLSKYPITTNTTTDIQTLFNMENQKFESGLSRVKYYNIYQDNESKLLTKLHKFLHTHKIFLYDKDGDCLMGNNWFE